MKNKYIFRNFVNNSNSISYNFECKKIMSITKSTFVEKKFIELINEYNGYIWYSKFKPINVKLTKNHRFNNMKLEIKYINGLKYKFNLGLSLSYKIIKDAIDYYNTISNNEYLSSNKYPLHGDFSLDNLLFERNEIYIIDWQYFQINNSPKGFDILNLIFEQFYYDYYSLKKLFLKNKKLFYYLISILKYVLDNLMVDNIFSNRPLFKIRDYIKTNKTKIWNDQISKLPIIKYKNEDVSFIDNYLKNHIN